jgi:deubiquitinase DESI2
LNPVFRTKPDLLSLPLSGALCNCILPGALKISAVRQDPDCVPEDSEKRRLMGSFNCFSSISISQKSGQSSSSLLGSSRVQKSCLPLSLKLT